MIVPTCRVVSRSLLAMTASLLLATASVLDAQVLTRVDLDNDAFNFWQAPKRRADREYTQGTRIAVLWPTSAAWAHRLLGGAQQCGVGAGSPRDCRMAFAAATQAMYTPNLDPRGRLLDERPFAGWLGGEFGVQRDRAHGLTSLSVSLGVTGKASLAEPGQKAVHRLLHFRPPVGWDAQIPNEVSAMITYRGAQDLVRLRHARSGVGLIAAPEWRARLGTVATDASAGFHIIAGVRPPSPWNSAASADGGHWGVFLRAGAVQHAVARNLFLDGTLWSPSQRVTRNPTFGETELGVGIRFPSAVLEWRVRSQGREYEQQPRPHAYSTFALSIR